MGSFHDAIRGKETISVIAEIKRRSPSHGDFPNHDVGELMEAYERGGASAVSVVTEEKLFRGSLELLRDVRRSTRLPILRKDFITEPEQIDETLHAGANAILLIARLLDEPQLQALIARAQELGLDPVLEIHNEEDLKKVSALDDVIIGINNRNLKTFQTDVFHATKFVKQIDRSRTIIAESAFSKAEELALYRGSIDAVLIGTTLLTAKNPTETLIRFTAAS